MRNENVFMSRKKLYGSLPIGKRLFLPPRARKWTHTEKFNGKRFDITLLQVYS